MHRTRKAAPFLKNKAAHAIRAAAVPNLTPPTIHATIHVPRRPSIVRGRSNKATRVMEGCGYF
jgi:hypothetical protein